jgi:hypothetical protein
MGNFDIYGSIDSMLKLMMRKFDCLATDARLRLEESALHLPDAMHFAVETRCDAFVLMVT